MKTRLPGVMKDESQINETEITDEQQWAQPKIDFQDTDAKTVSFHPETTTTSSTIYLLFYLFIIFPQ